MALDPAPDGGYANDNTAEGQDALSSLTSGHANTAVGKGALYHNEIGGSNTAVGAESLYSNFGGGHANTGIGYQANYTNEEGIGNTALGSRALYLNANGNNNIAIGLEAGYVTDGDNNINIANQGVVGESNTIRIGGNAHIGVFITGIHGNLSPEGSPVTIQSDGKLGVSALLTGNIIFLQHGSIAPSGYTQIGTWSTAYKDLNNHGQVLDVDIYRKD